MLWPLSILERREAAAAEAARFRILATLMAGKRLQQIRADRDVRMGQYLVRWQRRWSQTAAGRTQADVRRLPSLSSAQLHDLFARLEHVITEGRSLPTEKVH